METQTFQIFQHVQSTTQLRRYFFSATRFRFVELTRKYHRIVIQRRAQSKARTTERALNFAEKRG